jgi:rare lipoprotein A
MKMLAVVIVSLFIYGLAFADTASYYTYKSCIREGTSGVWTASGERYDENDLTCAMRSREWGTRYKITNLDNQKSVIVRLNDFGPNKKLWKKGRKCDLSKGAFQKIANLKDGVIRVKIEKVS